MAMSDPICGAIPPNVRGPVPCELDPGHEGEHFSTTGCAGSEIRWSDPSSLSPETTAEYARRINDDEPWTVMDEPMSLPSAPQAD